MHGANVADFSEIGEVASSAEQAVEPGTTSRKGVPGSVGGLLLKGNAPDSESPATLTCEWSRRPVRQCIS